jgi:hypothetical protein
MNLKELLDGLGYDVCSYSGRGMNGKRCIAIHVDDSNGLQKLMSEMVEHAGDNPEDTQWLAKVVRNTRMDSLGKRYVIYFPTVPSTDEENEDER